MKPIIIQNSKIPIYLSIFINIGAITLFPFILSREEMSEVTINHEKIHIEQQRELLVVFFYILYIWYWLIARVKGMNNDDAYMNIPFEKEAYANQKDFKYIENRTKNSWKDYIAK
jgi:hypothetical protein|tara:strand:- start:3604 stop:3948 length:345 start_codon:yes stop_codon:yes gene_type:complete